MTELSQIILQDHLVRKTKTQKDKFITLLQQHFPQLKVESSRFPQSRNLIVGDPETAKILLGEHYDTCARLPFPNFISPKKPLLSLLYGILIIIPAFAVVTLFSLLLARFITNFWVAYIITLLFYGLIIWLMLAGPANKHNANDNTSGVITLLEIYDHLSPQAKIRLRCCFLTTRKKVSLAPVNSAISTNN